MNFLLVMLLGGLVSKTKMVASVSFIFLLGLSGCAEKNRTDVKGRNDLVRSIGYYSNENHQEKTLELFFDNDRPVTALMDHSFGAEDNNQKGRTLQTEKMNLQNSTIPFTADEKVLNKDNGLRTKEFNYKQNNNAGLSFEKNAKISEQIREKVVAVTNVLDVRTVVYRSSVLITVNLRDKRQAYTTKKAIQRAVQPYTNERTVTIITDEGTFCRDQNNQSQVRAKKD